MMNLSKWIVGKVALALALCLVWLADDHTLASECPELRDKSAIFDAAVAKASRFTEFKASDFWTPQWKEVDRLDLELKKYLAGSKDRLAPTVLAHFEDYRFQYVGYLDLDGEKRIYANAFCKRHSEDSSWWRTHLYTVLDGGTCYFHATYDPATSKIVGLWINGLA